MRRLILLTCLLLFASPLSAAELRGTVSWIYDGDTLQIDGLGKVRLLGIDTPETRASKRDRFYQKNFTIAPKRLRSIARQAKRFNIKTVKGKQVRLLSGQTRKDKYGRLLAQLYLPDGRLLNRVLLEKGFATVFRRYPFEQKDDFLAAEKAARAAKIGLWQQ